jgi:tryptophan synthase alpha chain
VNRLAETFENQTRLGHAALVSYIMAGDPSLEATERFCFALQEAGTDVLELGVPFSDPIADGPIIQAAGQRALRAGTNLDGVIDLVRRMRSRGLTLPIVLMGYANPLLRMGPPRFANRALEAGIDGVIIPDLPFDEGAECYDEIRRAGLSAVQLVAPTSSEERIRQIAGQSSGFVYYVSLTGVTGVREQLPDGVVERIQAVQAMTPLPVAVGFGVSNPDMARALGRVARGVVVGSAIVRLIQDHGPDATQPLREFVGRLRKAIDEVELVRAS